MRKKLYTISPAKVENDPDFKWNSPTYKDMHVLDAKSNITKYVPLDFINLKNNEKKNEQYFKITSLKTIANGSRTMSFMQGERLVNERHLPESEFIREIFGRVYNENNNALRSNVSFMKVLTEIIDNSKFDINFKVYLIGTICDILTRTAPLDSGYTYSPTLMKINSLIHKGDNVNLIDPLSMMNSSDITQRYVDVLIEYRRGKMTTQVFKSLVSSIDSRAEILLTNHTGNVSLSQLSNRYNPNLCAYAISKNGDIITGVDVDKLGKLKPFSPVIVKNTKEILSPSKDLMDILKFLNKKKYSLSKEAEICFLTAINVKRPNTTFIGCMDENGNYGNVITKDEDVFYMYIDDGGRVVTSKTLSKGAPYSPITRMREIKAFVRDSVIGNNGTSEMTESIYKFLFENN